MPGAQWKHGARAAYMAQAVAGSTPDAHLNLGRADPNEIPLASQDHRTQQYKNPENGDTSRRTK